MRGRMVVVVVFVFGVWLICIDDISSVLPDSLETTPEPCQLTLKTIRHEFTEETTDI